MLVMKQGQAEADRIVPHRPRTRMRTASLDEDRHERAIRHAEGLHQVPSRVRSSIRHDKLRRGHVENGDDEHEAQ